MPSTEKRKLPEGKSLSEGGNWEFNFGKSKFEACSS